MTVNWKEALTDKQIARKNKLKLLRAQERKRLKHRYKRDMGCCWHGCNEKVIKNLVWRAQYDEIKNLPKNTTQKKLMNLGKSKFDKYFTQYGELVCKKHLKFESLLDYIEEREGDA